MNCTRCDGTGFLNVLGDRLNRMLEGRGHAGFLTYVQNSRETDPETEDVSVCDCCGDGEEDWHGTPGEHYGLVDPMGAAGPYVYNGGRCECH